MAKGRGLNKKISGLHLIKINKVQSKKPKIMSYLDEDEFLDPFLDEDEEEPTIPDEEKEGDDEEEKDSDSEGEAWE